MKHSILVTDGEQRAALALVRALGRGGHRVLVCSNRRHSLAGASRHCEREIQVPDPLTRSDEFAAAVAAVLRETGMDTLIPVADAALLALLPENRRVAGIAVPFPSLDVFSRVSDKALLMDTAESLGIGVPCQHVVQSPEDRSEAQLPVTFPVVLKPGRSVVGEKGTRTRVSVSYATNPAELAERLAAYPPAAYPILLQQRVVGPGIGVFLLLWDGVIQASFCHRRIREKPPSGGVSVYRESAEAPAFLIEKTRALLDRFGWRGVAMIEYKLDQEYGIPYLMEINGRFWGSLQLAVDAGVDFPNLLVALAHGEHPDPVTRYRLGVRSRWWWGDVDQLMARLTKSSSALALPPGSPSRLRALIDFLRLWRPGDRNEILRWDDPRPLVRETLDWLRRR